MVIVRHYHMDDVDIAALMALSIGRHGIALAGSLPSDLLHHPGDAPSTSKIEMHEGEDARLYIAWFAVYDFCRRLKIRLTYQDSQYSYFPDTSAIHQIGAAENLAADVSGIFSNKTLWLKFSACN